MKKGTILLLISLFIFFSFLYFPLNAFAKDYKSLAILPFELNAPDDISHIRSGIESMLYSRLYWKDKVKVIDSGSITHQIKIQNSKFTNPSPEQLAELLNLDYILTGYITHFSNAFSIDIRVYDRQKRQWKVFSEQSNSINMLIRKINVISAKINKKLFNREGKVYGKLVKKEKERAEQWKLQNPMERIPSSTEEDKTKKKSPFWKFWD